MILSSYGDTMDFIPTEIFPTIDSKITYPLEFKLIWEIDDQPDFSKLPPLKKVKYIQTYDENKWRMLKLTILAKYGAYKGMGLRYNIPSSMPKPKLQTIVDECAQEARSELSRSLRDIFTMVPIINYTPEGPIVAWKLP